MELTGVNVLVTGGDGFIGSHLVEALVAEGAKVRAFVFYNSNNSWGWLDTLPPDILAQVQVIAGDIRDIDRVNEAAKGQEVIFHLAAIIPIPFSYHSPRTFVETNINGTLNILQAARMFGAKKVLITSTSEVYGTARYVPIDEKHPLQGQSPYSATKIGADRLAESFYRSFDVPVVIVRPFNTYGPRQSARAVIPAIITQLLSGASTISLGKRDTVRDFNYVKDTVQGFIKISQNDAILGEEINIASGLGVTVDEVLNMLMKITGKTVDVVTADDRLRPEKSEVERLIGSKEKINQLTGWQPVYTLEQGLRETVAWFSEAENLAKYKAGIFNL